MSRSHGRAPAVMRRALVASLVGIAAVIGSPQDARADELFELESARAAAERLGLTPVDDPTGRRIAFIRVVREDVFVTGEVLPDWAVSTANAFHWLTDEDVVAEELLLAEGDVYDEARVQESMRTLRSLGIFSLVRILAVAGPGPGTIGLLVYTRDLWSLRLETAFLGSGSSLTSASVQLVERNLLGRNTLLGASFRYAPKTFTLGQLYADRRFAGAPLSAYQSFDVIFNRASGKPEGSLGSLSIGRPFYTLAEAWAWSVSSSYAVQVARPLAGSRIDGRSRDDGQPCDPSGPDCLRAVWRDRQVAANATVTYRRGVRYKQSFGIGVGLSDHTADAIAETDLAPGDEDDFARVVLPRLRRQVYPTLSYGLGLPRYATFENLGTFGQSETVNVGPNLGASFRFPLRAFGSSSNSFVPGGSLGYTLAGGDALLSISTSAGARLEDGLVVDQSLAADVRGATPRWFVGRLVARGSWLGRRNDTSNSAVSLGGDGGLRGYESDEFQVVGGNLWLANVEYRTLPVDVASVHLGAVLFYDVGSVYKATERIDVHHSAGAGLRLLVPQFNRNVFRFDFGVPLDRGGFRVTISYSSRQAITLTAAEG